MDSLVAQPEYRQIYLPAIPIENTNSTLINDKNAKTDKSEKNAKTDQIKSKSEKSKDIETEAEKTEKQSVQWQKDVNNNFCNIERQESHITHLNELSQYLQVWSEVRAIPLGRLFTASWVRGLLCAFPSQVHYNRDMTVSAADILFISVLF